jgi:hypothetical protein
MVEHPTPIRTSRSAFMFTVHVDVRPDEGVIESHPRELKIFPSPGTLVCITRSWTVAPLANVARGQTTVSWRSVIEQENPLGPVTVPA